MDDDIEAAGEALASLARPGLGGGASPSPSPSSAASPAATPNGGNNGDADGKRSAKRRRRSPKTEDPEEETSESVGWKPNKHAPLSHIVDATGAVLGTPSMQTTVQKGAKWDEDYEAFIFQKKNHFQVSVTAGLCDVKNTWQAVVPPAGIETHGHPAVAVSVHGPHEVRVFARLHAIKCEAPHSKIQLQQSMLDRSKLPFDGQELKYDTVKKDWCATICKLHFQEPTANNSRRNNRVNNEQRYFGVVVSIDVHIGDHVFTVASVVSDKIVVRSSHPKQFTAIQPDTNIKPSIGKPRTPPIRSNWAPGSTPNSIFFQGAVGVNTDTPVETLDVRGNLLLAGALLQVSDCRMKQNIAPVVGSQQQLDNLGQIKLFTFDYKAEELVDESWSPGEAAPVSKLPSRTAQASMRGADTLLALAGDAAAAADEMETTGAGSEVSQTAHPTRGKHYGVIAQQLQTVLPDAVMELDNPAAGSDSVSTLVVNKDRLLFECIGAIQQLSKTQARMAERLAGLEAEKRRGWQP